MNDNLWLRFFVVLFKSTMYIGEILESIVPGIIRLVVSMLASNMDTLWFFEDGQWIKKRVDLAFFAKKIIENKRRIDKLNLRVATIGYFVWEYESRKEIPSQTDLFFLDQLRIFTKEAQNEINNLAIINREWSRYIDERNKPLKWKWLTLILFVIFIFSLQGYIFRPKDD